MPNTMKELSILSVPKSDGTLQEYEIIDSALRQSVENNKPNWNAKEIIDSESGEITGYENGYISNKPAIKAGKGEKSIVANTAYVANGYASTASGTKTAATGAYSHAEGMGVHIAVTITGEANATTYTFVEDMHVSRIYTGYITLSESNTFDSNYVEVTNIDTENKIITVSKTLSDTAITSAKYYLVFSTTAVGQASHAEGISSVASGRYSHAEGVNTHASGDGTHAEGVGTRASGSTSHVEGTYSIASAQDTHAEGTKTTASGYASHAEGFFAVASKSCSHSEGCRTQANGESSHAEGYSETFELTISGEANALIFTYTEDLNTHLPLIGEKFLTNDLTVNSTLMVPVTEINTENKTITVSESISSEPIISAKYNLIICVTSSGYGSHAEGSSTIATAQGAHAEGRYTMASGQASHAEGNTNTASGNNSHVEGNNNIASGANSHAEGYNNNTSTSSSHIEGANNIVSGDAGHAEGISNIASGKYSHVEGQRNVASNYATHAEGYYTIASGFYSHTEGCGAISQSPYSHAEGYNTTTSSGIAHAEGVLTTATGYGAHSEGYGNRFTLQLTGDGDALTYTYTGDMPKYIIRHLQNNGTVKLMTTPNGSWTWNFIQNNANYHCVNVTAIDEENKTVTVDVTLSEDAISNRFCWFLLLNTSSGTGSHAEGVSTIVSGTGSHADGQYTFVSGHASSASGECTIASTSGQTVIGTYNIPDDTTTNLHPSQYSGFGKYAFIVGNGYDTGGTSNAHTLDWQGNGWYAGKLTVGSAPTNNMDVATKQYVDNHTPDLSGYVATADLETLVTPLIQAALAEYGDGDSTSYGTTS